MDVIQFIKNDVDRKYERPSWIKPVFYAGAFFLPVALGVFLRDSLDGVFQPRTFVANGLAAVLVGLASTFACLKNRTKRAVFLSAGLMLAFGLFLSIERIFFPPAMRTTYGTSADFWHESLKCFMKGGATTIILGAWLVFFAFATFAWPSRRWRALIAACSGVGGAVMLGFHCDSSSFAHVLVGHVGAGLVLGLLVFGLQEILFQYGIKRNFPELLSKLRNSHKLG